MDTTTLPLNPLDSLTKIDELWFEHGDVIFCVGSSKFRVTADILYSQSTIFRDMFSLPRGVGDLDRMIQHEGGESYTVITLPDDERDVYYFFRALFDASFYRAPQYTKYNLHVTVSILQMAHKYDVPVLILRAAQHLDDLFPVDQDDLDHIPTIDGDHDDWDYNDDWDIREIDSRAFTLEKYLNLIALLGLVEMRWIMPRIMYILVQQCGDPVVIMRHPSFHQLGSELQILVVQYEMIRVMAEESVNNWIGMLPAMDCETRKHCATLSRIVQSDDHKFPVRGKIVREPRQLHTPEGMRFCHYCELYGRQCQSRLQERFWDHYPVACAFGDWDKTIDARDKFVADLMRGKNIM